MKATIIFYTLMLCTVNVVVGKNADVDLSMEFHYDTDTSAYVIFHSFTPARNGIKAYRRNGEEVMLTTADTITAEGACIGEYAGFKGYWLQHNTDSEEEGIYIPYTNDMLDVTSHVKAEAVEKYEVRYGTRLSILGSIMIAITATLLYIKRIRPNRVRLHLMPKNQS